MQADHCTLRFLRAYHFHLQTFYNNQKKEVQDKIDYIIGLVRTLQMVPERFFKHLEGTDGIYEMRVKVGSDIYRIFCFFDQGQLIILLNGFQKKKDKNSATGNYKSRMT